jgi:hypothetical protein
MTSTYVFAEFKNSLLLYIKKVLEQKGIVENKMVNVHY